MNTALLPEPTHFEMKHTQKQRTEKKTKTKKKPHLLPSLLSWLWISWRTLHFSRPSLWDGAEGGVPAIVGYFPEAAPVPQALWGLSRSLWGDCLEVCLTTTQCPLLEKFIIVREKTMTVHSSLCQVKPILHRKIEPLWSFLLLSLFALIISPPTPPYPSPILAGTTEAVFSKREEF